MKSVSTERIHDIMFFLFVLILIIMPAAQTWAGEPTDLVRLTVEEARDIFNSPELSRETKVEKLRRLAAKRFDFREMARRSLARNWTKLDSTQKEEFVLLFTRLIVDSYSDRLRKYENEIKAHSNDKVLYIDERIEKDNAKVKTEIITFSGTSVSVEYRLLHRRGKWLAYDVVVEGVSLVNNYRSQFAEIIRNSSYEELVRRLKDRKIKITLAGQSSSAL